MKQCLYCNRLLLFFSKDYISIHTYSITVATNDTKYEKGAGGLVDSNNIKL